MFNYFRSSYNHVSTSVSSSAKLTGKETNLKFKLFVKVFDFSHAGWVFLSVVLLNVKLVNKDTFETGMDMFVLR